jgi:hypothetical protein
MWVVYPPDLMKGTTSTSSDTLLLIILSKLELIHI